MRKFPSKRKALVLGVVMAGMAMPVIAQDDVEQIIVTGSYIRGTPQDAPSPVNVIDRDSIEAQGASVIWDVIRNLEVNSGSDTSVSGSSDAGQLTGTAQVNLRNLGGNSTLTLINGKRFTPAAVVTSSGQEFVDLNAIPLVMTERVEVLTDGGSALYGSDAVAGVVNVIMRTDFEGLEVYGEMNGVSEASGKYDKTLSAIWGWGSDDGDTNFVISGEFFDRDAVGVEAANFYDANAGQYNGTVGALGTPLVLPGASLNPAYIRADLTALNIAEGGSSSPILQDPLCETLSGPNGAFYIDNRYSDLGENNATCRESTVDYSFIAVGQERNSIAASFNHRFSDNAEFYSFAQYSDAETERVGDGTAFSRSVHLYLPPPGTHSGPAAAATSFTELGAFAQFVGNARPTAADITNSPLSLANGGLGTAMFGGSVRIGMPRSKYTNITRNETTGIQAGLRGEFDVDGKAFNYDVSYSWSSSSVEQDVLTLNRENTELALQGLGGPNCTPNGTPDFDFVSASAGILGPFSPWGGLSNNFNDIPFPGYILNLRETFSYALTSNNHGQGGCEFFNPLLTALTDPALANSPELMDWMQEEIMRADKRNQLSVFDAVVSGELFEMDGGTAQFAAGLQYRNRNAKSRAPEINFPGVANAITGYSGGVPSDFTYITGNLECSGCIFNFDHDRDATSAFVELSLPFAENVETQVALRYEDYGGVIGSEVTPKIAMSWRPIEELLVRGSFSQSFRAPNIGVVEEAFESFGTSVQDPISNQAVRAGLLPATIENGVRESSFTKGAPNPNLGNEYADTYSVGFQWTPGGDLDGLTVGADIWRFEVSDRVLPQVPVAGLAPEIEAFNAVVGDPGNYILNESVQPDAAIPYEACDPNALAATFGVDSDERLECVVDPRLYKVDGIQRLTGSTDADLVTIVLPAVNGGNIEVQGVDLAAGYTWDNDYGRFRVGLTYTHVDEYTVSDIPGLDAGLKETGVTNAAGTDGDSPYVRSLPDNKGNITFSWSRDNHRVTLINRHIGSYKVLDYDARVASTSVRLVDYLKPKVDSYNTWDMQYNYTHSWGNNDLGTTVFTLGVIDAFNEDLPMYRFQTFDRSVFDGRGQRWYARALWQF
jgi:iron complex outermembrane recepter protein